MLDVVEPPVPPRSAWKRRYAPATRAMIQAIATKNPNPRSPEWLISLPARGTVNVHFSLLPAYRGPAPVQRAIMNGDRMTGVTTQMVVYELDAGDVLLTEEVAIRDDDTTATLLQRLTEAGGPLLLATVEALATGAITRRQQDHAAATYAPMITKEETEIDWALSAAAVSARVRAFNPNPGAFTWLDGKRLKVWMALPAPSEAAGVADAEPGTVRIASDGSPLVACAEGAATLLDVQMAGRAHVTGAEFARGARLAGIRLGRTPPGLSGA